MPGQAGSWREQLRREQQTLREHDRWRCLLTTDADGPLVTVAGRNCINLAGNDYLGLATHPVASVPLAGGAGASRLVTGNHAAYDRLETDFATWAGTAAAIAFPCGYMANSGIIPALVDRRDVVFSDRLNHASIVDGIRLSRARMSRYRHLDVAHLAELLARSPANACRRRLIVTESLFSMDGDRAPLAEIAELAVRYDAILVVDEAHAGGIHGPRGTGLAAATGLTGDHLLRLFTFGKAFGSYGACAAGSELLCQQLVNHARPLIYTTGLPPALVAGLVDRLAIIAEADDQRRTLHQRCALFRRELDRHGVDHQDARGPIFPIIVGADAAAVAVARHLRQEGIWATPIRPPTVPPGTARLRCTVTAAHPEEHLRRAAAAIAVAMREASVA